MNRAWKLCIVVIMVLLLLSACSQTDTVIDDPEVSEFSYHNVKTLYLENDPGIKTIGFFNTTKSSVHNAQDAIDLAKNECSIQYDSIAVAYDRTNGVWQVEFYTEGSDGGCLSVYLDDNGITLMTVAGE